MNRWCGGLFLFLVVVWGMSMIWITHGQQPAATAPAQYTWTGKSWPIESKGVGVSRRGFEAGARSDWHTHDTAVLYFVEEGRLRYQIRGEKVREAGLHETAYLRGGVPHWHGAAPGQGLTQLAVNFGAGRGLKWMEKVTDAQYSGK